MTEIEVHVRELGQLFNRIDPSPFHDRDLDPNAERFIEEWARDLPRGAPLALRVRLDQPSGPDDAAVLTDAVHQFFRRSAAAARQRLRELFRRGRISLGIALVFLMVLGELASLLSHTFGGALGSTLREGLLIGGWVAMWRPLEVFLYDWWPIRAQARLRDRLAAMPVRIEYSSIP